MPARGREQSIGPRSRRTPGCCSMGELTGHMATERRLELPPCQDYNGASVGDVALSRVREKASKNDQALLRAQLQRAA